MSRAPAPRPASRRRRWPAATRAAGRPTSARSRHQCRASVAVAAVADDAHDPGADPLQHIRTFERPRRRPADQGDETDRATSVTIHRSCRRSGAAPTARPRGENPPAGGATSRPVRPAVATAATRRWWSRSPGTAPRPAVSKRRCGDDEEARSPPRRRPGQTRQGGASVAVPGGHRRASTRATSSGRRLGARDRRPAASRTKATPAATTASDERHGDPAALTTSVLHPASLRALHRRTAPGFPGGWYWSPVAGPGRARARNVTAAPRRPGRPAVPTVRRTATEGRNPPCPP